MAPMKPKTRAAETKHRSLRLAALALAVVPLTLTACGGGDSAGAPTPTVASLDTGDSADSSTATDTAESPVSDEPLTDEQIDQAMLKYDQCLRDNGVDIDTGGQGESLNGEGGDENSVAVIDDVFAEENADAFATCDPIIEGVFGSFEPTPEEEAAMADAEAAFQNCMSAAGFDVSSDEPVISDDGDGAAMEAALSRCADEAFGALENGSELSEVEEED